MTTADRDIVEQSTPELTDGSGDDIPIREEVEPLRLLEPAPADSAALKTIYFGYDRSHLRTEQQSILRNIVRRMATTDYNLLIEGHCDERGTDEYNSSLGERRALAVFRLLVDLGAAPERLSTISFGEEKPEDPGHNEAAWSRNRRVEFRILAR